MALQRDGGPRNLARGFCGGALTLTTRGQGTGRTSRRCNHRSSTWNGQHGLSFSVFCHYPSFMFQYVHPFYTRKDSLSRVYFFFAGFTDDIEPCPHPNSKSMKKKVSIHCHDNLPPKPTTSEQVRIISTKSVQEQTGLCIRHHPRQPFLEILPRHGAAPQHIPPMRLDLVQSQRPQDLVARHTPDHVRLVYKDEKAGP